MTIVAGVDIGSLSTDVVILKDGKTIAQIVHPTGSNSGKASELALEKALNHVGVNLSDIAYIVSTGYGRISAEFSDKQVTEITCHGKGMHYLNPQIRTVIDIGGQDSKAIKLTQHGDIEDFVMNDKCAAGTGRFLEVMASALEVDLEEFTDISMTARNGVDISSMCTVFAESEVVSLIAEGVSKDRIIRGLVESVGERTEAMAGRIHIEPPIGMSGGVAKNRGVVKALEERLNAQIYIPDEPQVVGALGAALLAEQICTKHKQSS